MNETVLRILLIEDDEEDKIVFEHLLKKIKGLQYELEWEADGTKVSNLCIEDYDIIFLDHNLRTCTGLDILKTTKDSHCLNENKDICNPPPIVFLTGQSEQELHYKAIEAGASGLLIKDEINAFMLERTIDYTLQLHKAKERAESANRFKTEFIDTVSHEFRTPLTSIKGPLDFLMDEGLTKPQKEMVAIAKRNTDRLLLLVNDLLDFQKLEAGKMTFECKKTNLSELVLQTIEDNKGYGKEYGISFTVTQLADAAFALVAPARVKQIMANLLSNAAKFSLKGKEVKISVVCQGEWVCVSVTDHGHGIPEEFRNKIFGRFIQADSSDTREKGGTGLGLAITKNLVEKMGGEIGFETEVNEGTTFRFRFPAFRQ